eukprot:TRINITY_DN40080_c0_g1_i1.p1 TRINITY_DN40080_c0_g1~~TRINITY_DN40080_c0_g1_i1.p1  ORF type:complete len:427 (+),score=49.29 TRINITY_DN40080_c0_g1_i1:27-1307(+)
MSSEHDFSDDDFLLDYESSIGIVDRSLSLSFGDPEIARELLVTRVFATLDGWLVKYALSQTYLKLVLSQPIQASHIFDFAIRGSSFDKAYLVMYFLIFCVMLLGSALLSQLVYKCRRLTLTQRKTLFVGLGYVPTWAWKDVVNNLIVGFMAHNTMNGLEADELAFAFAVAFTGISALVQVVAEAGAGHTKINSFAHHVFTTLRNSLGLGVGFAWNEFVAACFSQFWGSIWFQLAYVGILTFALMPLQYGAQTSLSMCSKRLDKRWCARPVLSFSAFVQVSYLFVVAWAYADLINSAFDPLASKGLPGQLQLATSVVVTALGIVIVELEQGTTCFFVLWRKEQHEDLARIRHGAVMMIAGLNVGWSWMTLCGDAFNLASLNLGLLWGSTCVIVATTLFLQLSCFKCTHLLRREDTTSCSESEAEAQS